MDEESRKEESSCSKGCCGTEGYECCFVKGYFCAPKAAPKAGAPPRDAAQKAAAVKTVPHAAPSAVSGAIVTETVTTGRQGVQGTTKARLKRSVSAEQSSAQTTK
jgi:hypothetical protein